MLSELRIENLALVETLHLEFGAGLTALTGETGAGKSLVIGALDLVLGARAASGLVRRGTERTQVTARFEDLDPAAFPEAGCKNSSAGRLLKTVRGTMWFTTS